MKFTTIRLENVFAYDGAVDFDFSVTAPGKNIVLIWGRNGMGKTSFLNAVKLLFTGMDQTESRKVGFPPVQLAPKQYLLGDGSRWSGVINRSARRRAANAGKILDAKISITWIDEKNQSFTATRWWTIEGDDYNEGLYVDGPYDRLAAGPATEFLAETLPSDFVKFFFFDGEEIKSIAESSGKQSDFDRLLQISFVEELAGELEKLAGERRRRGMQAELRRKVDDATAALRRADTSAIEAEEKLAEIDAQLTSDSIELKRLEIRRANLSSGASELQRNALESQKQKLLKRLEILTEQIVSELPIAIPLVANMKLLKQASDQVDSRLAAGGSAEAHFVKSVNSEIPIWLQEVSPDLSENAVMRIATYIVEKLEKVLSATKPSGLFENTDLLRMERLRRVLDYWNVAGIERRESQARLVVEASQIKSELHEVEDALMHLEVGAQGNVEEYRNVVNRIEELKEAEAKQYQLKGSLKDKLEVASKSKVELLKQLKALEASQDQASTDAKDSQLVMRVAKTLNEIAQSLKEATREELEVMLNDRFRRIITHPLIERISIDDTYSLTFYEKSGRSIGRTSLSSGMKQLAATALLWAMKDCAGRDIPVIIDTPLGRIDKENQEHLLLSYYPALSHQVIILPTNAEIDGRKAALLERHVARHYTIQNSTGDAAEISLGSLVEPV